MAAPREPGRWRKPVRIALFALAGFLALLLVVFATAWALMPREWIQQEARRQVGRMSQARVQWKRLTPDFQNWSLGVTVEDLELRMPETGPPRVQARLPEAFVRFRLFPLLLRRVEVSGARIRGGGIVLTDQGPSPPSPGEKKAAQAHVVLPRVELDGVSLRTRDPLGSGYDLKNVEGSAEIDGTLDRPRAVRLEASADSLYWKPEARSPLLALPSPLSVKVALDSRDGGQRLVVTEGEAKMGPLQSRITGEVRVPPAPAPAQLALRIAGGPQTVRSSDPELRALAGKSPASFSATLSWDIRVGGTARDVSNQGRLLLKPFSVSAESNTFTMDQASVSWASRADQTFVGRAEGFGGGVTFTAEARGVTRTGGEIRGSFYARAPAERLNGLTVNGPKWNSGDLECRGTFVSHPPAAVGLEYTVTGTGMSGTMPGLARPIRRLTFAASGDATTANLSALEAVVGTTTAKVTGTVKMGTVPSGVFDVKVDRLVAEEWTLASSGVRLDSSTPGAPAAKSPIPAIVANMTIGELRNRGLVVRNVTAPVRFSEGKIVADPIKGSISGGTVEGALDIAGATTKPSYTLHLDLKQVPVEDLAAGLLPIRLPVSGTMSDVIDLRGEGFPGPQGAANMTGTVAGTIERGLLRQTPALKQLRAALGAEAPTDVPFQVIKHAARIEGGKLLLDKVTGDLGKDLFSISGALGFDQSLDLNALLRLAPSRVEGGGFLAQIARYARDSEGRIPVEVKITGTALAPKVSIRPGKLVQTAAGEIFKEQFTKLLGGGKDSAAADGVAPRPKTGREILGKLFGKKEAPPAAPDTARPAARDSAAKPDSAGPARKALERLLGK
jgi:hypothetical protein